MWSKALFWCAICLLLVFAGAPRASAQTPAEQFELARNAFHYQDYDKVIELLSPLLVPEPRLPSGEMVLQAREWLGAAFWWKKDQVNFKQEFTRLLQAQGRFELDSFYYPPEMVKDFKELKKQLVALGIIEVAEVKKPGPQVIIEKTIETRSGVVNFVPFGGGQFANGVPGKAAFFMSTELLCLAANGGSWLYMYNAQPGPELRTAATWTMYGSLVALGGFYIWGVLDAFADWEPRRLIEEKRLEKPAESASMLPVFPHPFFSGGGLGLGLGTSF